MTDTAKYTIETTLTNYTTGEEIIERKEDVHLGPSSTIDVCYDGGRVAVWCGSTVVFETKDAGIDFSLSIKPC